ncbi:hypothetical protein PInf_004710 [Phytophthora infestans]|nr:hypothetical protein PInf_004710 [Phytophthora infestans]
MELQAEPTGPLVDRPSYPTPRMILQRDRRIGIQVVEIGSKTGDDTQSRSLDNPGLVDGDRRELKPGPRIRLTHKWIQAGHWTKITDPVKTEGLTGEGESRCLDPVVDPTKTEDEQVCYHEDGDLHAEDLGEGMAVIPEVPLTTEEVTIDDIQVEPGANEPAEIWESRHLLIGKGNALPPAARGVKCDIDVGDAKPIAQRVRKVAPQFRKKLSDLIKGLLQAKIISFSTSPHMGDSEDLD